MNQKFDKRDKAHGRLVPRTYYVEDLVANYFGLSKYPEFHNPKFPGIHTVGISADKVFIYVKDDETASLVHQELEQEFLVDERDFIEIKVIGEVMPAV